MSSNQSDSDFAATFGKRPKVKTPVAARYLAISEITLESDRSSGRLGIPFFRLGRSIVYDLDELDTWLASRRAR